MNKDIAYALIHSPLVGRLTWSLVASQMQQRGLDVIVPVLKDSPRSKDPYWKQHAESVSQAFAQIPHGNPFILVAHSGAGPLLPAIRQLIPNPVKAYVFVDAGIPRDRASRLELMKLEDPQWTEQFQGQLERDIGFPNWNSDDLRDIIPSENLREKLVAEIRPRSLDFFTEPIPVFAGWPDAPCEYIQFSAAYDKPAEQARRSGWKTYKLEAGHFHMLVDPNTVINLILESLKKMG